MSKSKRKPTLLERGQWCMAISVAASIEEEGERVSVIAEMLMEGITAYKTLSEKEVRNELLSILDKEEPNLIPYTFQELVELAEETLGIK